MSSFAEQYIDKIIEMLQRVKEEEAESLKQAAGLLADAVENGQRIFAWGCTHSSTTMQDIFARAGGLMLIGPAAAADRLNVLFITLDDMNRDSIGVYGAKVPKTTPNIDRLASEGLRFEHAHVTIAICQGRCCTNRLHL